jgi:translation initiation factor IF-2
VPNPNKITPILEEVLMLTRSRQVSKGNRPAIVAKVEPEEEDKTKLETLEKLQGKGGKSKAAKYRRDKEITQPSEI